MWHLRPACTWQDGKWIEWPTASLKSPSQGDTPTEKRAKSGHLDMENLDYYLNLMKKNVILWNQTSMKKLDVPRPVPLFNEKELILWNERRMKKLDHCLHLMRKNFILAHTRYNKFDGHHAVTELQKEGLRVVFGVPKPGKKQKFIELSKHLDSEQSSKITITSDSIKPTRYLMPQRSGGCSLNNISI